MGACRTWWKDEVRDAELTGLLRPVLCGVPRADLAKLPMAQECSPRYPAAAAEGGMRARSEPPCLGSASRCGQGPLGTGHE